MFNPPGALCSLFIDAGDTLAAREKRLTTVTAGILMAGYIDLKKILPLFQRREKRRQSPNAAMTHIP